MRFLLKDFQIDAADRLIEAIDEVTPSVRRGRLRAIVLSSPTGSGKTVIATELIERVMFGHGDRPPDKNAVFLWLSDSPELNEQSRRKIVEASDRLIPDRLKTIESSFDQKRLYAGHVYFLNTQKLSATGKLTSKGDDRSTTIWECIDSTARAAPGSFYLVIDEAHKGMREADANEGARARRENARLTIVQRFIKGYAEGGLAPVPLIVGVSATPERFQRVLAGAERPAHDVVVDPAKVQLSGLIKDRIKLAGSDRGDETDWSMLAEAGRRLARYTDEWKRYCEANAIVPVVRPILVVQVENGTGKVPTKTNLETCIRTLNDACGPIPAAAYAHCFDEPGDVVAGNYRLRKIDASDIQGDAEVRVVFFKTALTTGWDCPRAEVMMSFRTAEDPTTIAQLVGRMVRTPLARRIESNDFLNDVSLWLPHYDASAVDSIIKELQKPETAGGPEVEKEENLVTYPRAKGTEDLFEALAKVPTYSIDRPKKLQETVRLMRLARMLSRHSLGQGLIGEAKAFVVARLLEQRARLAKDPEWADRVEGQAKVPVNEYTVGTDDYAVEGDPEAFYIEATEENIYDLFQRGGNVLGEGLHESYANRREFRGDINTARLELFLILRDAKARSAVQEACRDEFERLWKQYRDDIRSMKPPVQEQYNDLRRRGGKVEEETLILPDSIEVRKGKAKWESHLYADAKGVFHWDPKGWEKPVMEHEQETAGYAGFLRNVDRKRWAVCLPYGADDENAMYPDLLIFRRVKGKVRIDMLEPHGDQFADGVAKAKGLATYAKRHGEHFGRIEIIRVKDKVIQRLDMQDETVRRKVLNATTPEQLADLYAEVGS